MDIIIYTHSDYFDILPIQLEFFSKIVNQNKYKVHILSDKNIEDCNYNVIVYDDKLPYASRLLYGLNKIDAEYILITHEIDILVKIDESLIDKLPIIMKKHNIDSVELKQGINICDPVYITPSLLLSRKNTGYIYTVQPTIWNKNKFIFLLNNFKDETYRTIESDRINKFMLENLKTYITYSFRPIKTIWYHVTEPYYFIHLTSRLLLLPCSKTHNLDSYIQEQHEYIYDKYLKNNKTRGFQPSLYSFLSHMVTDYTWK